MYWLFCGDSLREASKYGICCVQAHTAVAVACKYVKNFATEELANEERLGTDLLQEYTNEEAEKFNQVSDEN
jgi:hypothetical protein